MKYLSFVIAMMFGSVFAADLYVDAYRFNDVNYTGGLGVSNDKYHAEYYFNNGKASVGTRTYISFTNIEIGINSSLTNKVHKNAPDHRVIDIEGGYYYVAMPYITVGDKIFATLMLDETNSALVRVGFNLW